MSIFIVYALLILSLTFCSGKHHHNKDSLYDEIGKDNWEQLLEGEWMIKFYLQPCLTCKLIEPVWKDLAEQKKELGIKVGKMQILDAPDLNFLDRQSISYKIVPALYHVKNGVFRQYKGQMHQDLLTKFILKKIWKNIKPVGLINKNLTDFNGIENQRISDEKSTSNDKENFNGLRYLFITIAVGIFMIGLPMSVFIYIFILNAIKKKKHDNNDIRNGVSRPATYMGYEKFFNDFEYEDVNEKRNELENELKNNGVQLKDSKFSRYTTIDENKLLLTDQKMITKACGATDPNNYFNNLTVPNESETQQLKKILFPEKCINNDEKNLTEYTVAPSYMMNTADNKNNIPQKASSSNNAFYKAVYVLSSSDFSRIENPRTSAKKAAKIDYLIHYTKITCPQQKRHYKKEFYAHYAEYLRLHQRAIKISQQFKVLRKKMKKKFGKGSTVEYEEIRRRFLEKYFESRDVHEKYYYLHNKLRYIKKLVAEYEAECDARKQQQSDDVL